MSSLITSNISDGTTSVPTGYVVNGSAKAWVNFNGTGTPAIVNSLNASSLSDDATGTYTITYTNNFSAADYSATGLAGARLGDIGATFSASGTTRRVYDENGTLTDVTVVTLTANGDLA